MLVLRSLPEGRGFTKPDYGASTGRKQVLLYMRRLLRE
jgi:hypothetical protein